MGENNKKINNLIKLNKAWLVFWHAHAQKEKEFLKQNGINRKYLNILSARKEFTYIIEYAENIYQLFMMSFSEKADLANYNKGNKNKAYCFGGTVPVFTHYQSNVYRDLIKSIESNGINSKQADMHSERFKNYPEYVIVGHNPSVEIFKVFNLIVYKDEDGDEKMEWNSLSVNGKLKRKSCKNGW
jgi:hypothetical protein